MNIKKKIKENRILYFIICRIKKRLVFNFFKKKIRGRKNRIEKSIFCFLKNVRVNIDGDNNKIVIKDGVILNNVKFYIRGNNCNIIIGNNVEFRIGGEIWIEDNECYLNIGNNTTFQNVHIAITEDTSKIIIGRECMFAYDIDIRTGDSHSIIDCTTNKRTNMAGDVIIGDHVWVAAHSSILKNTLIKDNSVVATRAVVTKKFNFDNILIAGCPARMVKANINWDRKRL